MTDEELREMVAAADVDGDGQVDGAEFWKLLKKGLPPEPGRGGFRPPKKSGY